MKNDPFILWKLAMSLFWGTYKSVIVIVLIILALFVFNRAYGQVTFTPEELRQLAEQNLERKECLEVNQILEKEIDSLQLKQELMQGQMDLKDSTIVNLKDVVKNYGQIEDLYISQKEDLIEENKEKEKVIKKQNRRLNFWRIFTPVTVTGVAIVGLFVK
jgi:hypothetical protein